MAGERDAQGGRGAGNGGRYPILSDVLATPMRSILTVSVDLIDHGLDMTQPDIDTK